MIVKGPTKRNILLYKAKIQEQNAYKFKGHT